MTSLTIALGAMSLLTLVALMLAVTAICQARAVALTINKRLETPEPDVDSASQGFRADLDGLAAQIHDMQQLPPQTSIPVAPRGGMNLAKRSQALRFHRHGNTAAQIASTLELPVQEVELLLKVQSIILRDL